ncbi:conserved exported hypothetical protein [Candidatus Desulfarcum epimagneticum]|uniref:Lipoprotein n=1 Tax=uncultured Desulfobacteraceae bacterium TaxID=218296 RepID=A0A484HFM9_9BACT|nr:conserved exported hypothetical protein [uncultured Desulfobacteraceae bacterium]
MRIKRSLKHAALFFMAAALLSGCAALKFGKFPSYFDENTYQRLTFAKADILFLYASFGESVLDMDEIRSARVSLARLYEYEKGKGKANAATARQVELIRQAFEDHLQNRMGKVKWDDFDVDDFSENIGQYFDIAIETERSKNKKWKK